MAKIHLKQVKKTYGKGPKAVDVIHGIDIDIADGEFIVMVGPSGCGKSTLLRMVAGLEEVSSGQVIIGERVVNDLEPKERDIAMVFQNYALYPHMSVYENMAYGLKIQNVPKVEIETRVQRAAEILELGALLQRTPRQLSGGQRQRVAMGRAIVRKPAVFLFDEPLSNLDAKLRIEVRSEIKLMHQRLGTTIVYVTHDQIEAMTLGDRIAVMKDGVVQQFGAPQEIYDSPSNLFVAGFIGSPPMNFINGTLVEAGSGVGMLLETGETKTVLNLPFKPAAVQNHIGQEVILGLRPERITDKRHAHSTAESLLQEITVKVDVIEPTGPDTLVFTQINNRRTVCRVHPSAEPRPHENIALLFDVSRAVLFDPKSEGRIA